MGNLLEVFRKVRKEVDSIQDGNWGEKVQSVKKVNNASGALRKVGCPQGSVPEIVAYKYMERLVHDLGKSLVSQRLQNQAGEDEAERLALNGEHPGRVY